MTKKDKTPIVGYIKTELSKIDWPKLEVVVQGSFVIVCIVIFFVSFVACLDIGFSYIIGFIENRLN